MMRARRLIVVAFLFSLKLLQAQGFLFDQENPLPIKFSIAFKEVVKDTNDSTYLRIPLEAGGVDSLNIKMRVRGNFRKNHCYFPPLKWKISKKEAKGTAFEGNRKLKLVLPCLLGQNSDDDVLEEYMAYKIYETMSPFHFKTRLVNVQLKEIRGNRTKSHDLIGFLIEDDEKVLERIKGQKGSAKIHPLQHDAHSSVLNSFFQYLIANTDYSVRSQHNNKLVLVHGKIVYIPYDFDMSGLVNAPYATISGTQNLSRQINQVTQRVYKGYLRDSSVMDSVRRYYLRNKSKVMAVVENTRNHFKSAQNHAVAKKFIHDFYAIIEDDKKYEKFVLREARLH